ncbi:MAG: hypothetical protein A2314_02575 [Elusimicrobia bacterium RIFOXYB2_FULL_50_12]|nr:MAG: hypothetical protein A2314_02575 [Elusimicrobia bacterium RIFOXYB2_FULL_50_12]
MSIILVRIDDRLIHGQIVEGWLKPINANHILVISDDVARDRMQQILLGMAVPKGVKFTSLSVDEGSKKINDGFFNKDRVLLLVPGPEPLLRLLRLGVKFESVNVGGMHYGPGKKQILRTLCVDKDDIDTLMEIGKQGVELEGRVLPDDERINIMEVIGRETQPPAAGDDVNKEVNE